MNLSDGSASSLTSPPPPLPSHLDAGSRVLARFAITGNVVITGGAGTLGVAAARALLEHGASGVALWDLEATLRSSLPEIQALASSFPDRRVFGLSVDVTDVDAIAGAVQSTAKTLGSLSHLFCFAGIVGCHHALEMTETQWRRTLDVNTTGAFLCAQAVAKQIIAQIQTQGQTAQGPSDTTAEYPPPRGGSVTFVASISAHRVNFPQPQAAYNVSKAALVSLTKSLAAEWAVHGIRVNSISPGYMDTILNAGEGNIKTARETWASRNPMGRMGAVGELDGVCVLLASRAGSYINGADFVVDGGATVF